MPTPPTSFSDPPVAITNERLAALLLGVDDILVYAATRPAQLGIKETAELPGADDYEDALRHILLAAELHRLHPKLAGPLLNAHESITGTLQGQSKDQLDMDLFNNEIGKQIGLLSKSRKEVELRALIALPKAKVLRDKESLGSSP